MDFCLLLITLASNYIWKEVAGCLLHGTSFIHVSILLPSSAYQVVVVEEDGSRQVRRRELGSVDCFPTPNSHTGPQAKGGPHYYTAELAPSSLPEATPFTVGDNHTYNGYWNSPLDPTKNYLIYFQATSNFRGVSTIRMPDEAFVTGVQTHSFYVSAALTVDLDLCQTSQKAGGSLLAVLQEKGPSSAKTKALFITKWADVCNAFFGWLLVDCLERVNLVNVTPFLNENSHKNITRAKWPNDS